MPKYSTQISLFKALPPFFSYHDFFPNITFLSPFVPFSLRKYNRLLVPCLDVEHFQSKQIVDDLNCVDITSNDADRLSIVGGWIKRWMYYSGHCAVLFHDVTNYVHMPFIRFPEKKAY